MKPILYIISSIACMVPYLGTAGHNSLVAESKYIEFHSQFLVNLHHFTYQRASRFSLYKHQEQQCFDTLFRDIASPIAPAMKTAIMKSIQFYADSLVKRNLLFDPQLTAFKYALQSSEDISLLKKDPAYKLWANALADMQSFYRLFYWETQDRQNREFIQSRLELISKTEQFIMDRSAECYGYTYTGKKFRVDITGYATFFGAYTTTEPYVSATISGNDKRHEGTQGIEVIFHEVSHAMIDKVFEQQAKTCTSLNIPLDHNVWHTILFYSTGTFVKQALANCGETHELYMYRHKITEFNPAVKQTAEAVAKHWNDYLEHRTSMEKAIELILGTK